MTQHTTYIGGAPHLGNCFGVLVLLNVRHLGKPVGIIPKALLCIFVRTRACVRACVRACFRACVPVCLCACVRACVLACVSVRVRVCVYVRVHIDKCIHTYIHTICLYVNAHIYIMTPTLDSSKYVEIWVSLDI